MSTEQGGVDAELRALVERIAVVRASIAEVKAERERIEGSAPPPTDEERALVALRARVKAARAELAADVEPASEPSAEASARRGLYVMGSLLAVPGAMSLGSFLFVELRDPEEKLGLSMVAIMAVPLLLGLAFLARARFATFRPETQDLDGDFL